MYRFVAMAPPSVRARLGIATDRIGGGVAIGADAVEWIRHAVQTAMTEMTEWVPGPGMAF
jgi:hypothetical protein